jgi:RES domain-containing protein
VGVPVLYLADSIKTCVEEIGMGTDEVAEVGEFVLLQDLVVWDVRITDIKEFVSMPSLNARAISKEYIFPNFLAQCCAAANIDRIIYGSVKNPPDWNIAMFNYLEDRNITIQKINSRSFS